MLFHTTHKQDFRFAVLAIVVVGTVTFAGMWLGFPRLSCIASIIGLAMVGERMFRVWRTSTEWPPRLMSTAVLLAALALFSIAGLSFMEVLTHSTASIV